MTTTCYNQILFSDHVQEMYETSSRHAARRAKELRQANFRVSVAPLGPQVTGVGIVRMTSVTAYGDLSRLPYVKLELI